MWWRMKVTAQSSAWAVLVSGTRSGLLLLAPSPPFAAHLVERGVNVSVYHCWRNSAACMASLERHNSETEAAAAIRIQP